MIDIKKIQERKKIRAEILEELYKLWFSGEFNALVGTKQELYQGSKERHLAFHYLLGMEFITITPMGGSSTKDEILSVHISAKGIEHVESNYI
ncbi:hypothetical protein P4H71_20580 [Paenibacillus kribbensis]|uniref:hypothetical protein n=1 Tax=Paenibacillus kribbensis TaxID=172713 RepID=UPI002DB9A193|nr:hypothetical protein [Paenibacillus kribbensis]MEC0236719.1 hypothetical protein [Paenibacillus kribbensis]